MGVLVVLSSIVRSKMFVSNGMFVSGFVNHCPFPSNIMLWSIVPPVKELVSVMFVKIEFVVTVKFISV